MKNLEDEESSGAEVAGAGATMVKRWSRSLVDTAKITPPLPDLSPPTYRHRPIATDLSPHFIAIVDKRWTSVG